MQTQTQLQRNVITLKGSAQTVSEFFQFGVNNILYQRGVYPPEAFETKKQYGLSLWQTTEESLSRYLTSVLGQAKGAGTRLRSTRWEHVAYWLAQMYQSLLACMHEHTMRACEYRYSARCTASDWRGVAGAGLPLPQAACSHERMLLAFMIYTCTCIVA